MLLLAAQAADTPTLPDQIEEIDFRVLADVLRRRRLLGLLGQRLISAAGSLVPSEFADAVQEIIAEGRRRAEIQQMATWGILGALAGSGRGGDARQGCLLWRMAPRRRRSPAVR
jgi:hypothetical protein